MNDDLNGVPEPPEGLFDHMKCDPEAMKAAIECWQAGWMACMAAVAEAHGDAMPNDPISALTANTISQHELFRSYMDSGFDPGQALHLLGLSVVAAILKP